MKPPIPYPKRHPSGQAFVAADKKLREAYGLLKRFYYFGVFGTDRANEKYQAWRCELAGHPAPSKARSGCLVHELIERYRQDHPEIAAGRSGLSAINVIQSELGTLGVMRTGDYGPLAFQEHRKQLLASATRCARQVNDLMQFVQRIFKWGVSKQLVSLETWSMLKTVERLKPHESPKKTKRRAPVPATIVAASLPCLSEHCADMVRLIVATKARPGEIASLRADEISKSYQARPGWWFAEKTKHKTSNKGKKRWLEFPPETHHILERYWPEDGMGFLFPSKQSRGKCLHYQVTGLRAHISHMTRLHNLPHWFPYQLRHLSLTDIAGKEGLEAAKKAGGQSSDAIHFYIHEPPRRAS